MADIELIIKISEEDLKSVGNKIFTVEEMFETTQGRVYRAIVNGIPLPKGHGRLIDADALIDTLGCSDRDIYAKACIEEDAPTILEADKTESEDEE